LIGLYLAGIYIPEILGDKFVRVRRAATKKSFSGSTSQRGWASGNHCFCKDQEEKIISDFVEESARTDRGMTMREK